jgi:hypothetical protein
MNQQSPAKVVLYCQRCGLSQIAIRVEVAGLRGTQVPLHQRRYAVKPCERTNCRSIHFNPEHPSSRIPNWRWPGLSPNDKRFLRSLRIVAFTSMDTLA